MLNQKRPRFWESPINSGQNNPALISKDGRDCVDDDEARGNALYVLAGGILPWLHGPRPNIVIVCGATAREVCKVTGADLAAAVAQRGPAVRDLHPLPETREAKAPGCRCTIARAADGAPRVDRYGQLTYVIERDCDIHS